MGFGFPRGFLWFVLIALVIGGIGGFFIGKKFGVGKGILSGVGIFIASLLAISNCPPCTKIINDVTGSIDSPVPKSK